MPPASFFLSTQRTRAGSGYKRCNARMATGMSGVHEEAETPHRPRAKPPKKAERLSLLHSFRLIEQSLAEPSPAHHPLAKVSLFLAKVEPLANGAQLVLENSGRKIAYSRLCVTDATGKEQNTYMITRRK